MEPEHLDAYKVAKNLLEPANQHSADCAEIGLLPVWRGVSRITAKMEAQSRIDILVDAIASRASIWLM
jgi:hypothetical protein